MTKLLSAAILTVAMQPAVAQYFDCEGAAAFYNSAIFSMRVVGDVSGACAENLSQPACSAYLRSFIERRELLERSQQGDMNLFLTQLKNQCPDHLPEDPTQFE